jgi:hypothetical protein
MLSRGFPIYLFPLGIFLLSTTTKEHHKLYCCRRIMEPSSKSLSGATLASKPSTTISIPSSNTSSSRMLFGEVDSSCNHCKKSRLSDVCHGFDAGLLSIQKCTINLQPHTLFQPIVSRILECGSMSRRAASSSCALRFLSIASCVPWNQRASH